jgi:hypothetical protein
MLGLSKGPNGVGISLAIWRRKQIQFPKRCDLHFLENWTMDKVQKPSNSEYCAISSEPFTIDGFLGFVHRPDSKELGDKNKTFQKMDLFPSWYEGRHLICWVS